MDSDSDDSLNPWAGLASYEDPETAKHKLLFCGRDDDSYDVAKLIMGNIFVTLYGKSGIGKTSLLNAGVFPELREEQFTPTSLRLGMRDADNTLSYQTVIVEAVERAVGSIEIMDVVEAQDNQQSLDYLWNYFVRRRFYDKNGEPTTPVLVFDQFEEIFRYDRSEVETLLRQLDYINDKDHTVDPCTIDGRPYRYENNSRFVVSIREDDLYRLEDSLDNCYLPALKRCRYRLRSLSEEGAHDAIVIPGKGLFKADEQQLIVETIITIARNKEDNSISTNLLSLVCNRLYVESQRNNATTISAALVDSFVNANPFERFYNEATQGFSNREKSYIEEHLVDSTGRRNSMPESDFLLHVRNGSKLLEGKNRILQRVSTSHDGKNYRIELIHDSFCEPLSYQKEKRKKRQRLFWLALATGILLLSIAAIVYIASMANKNVRLEGTNQELVDSLRITLANVEKERDAVVYANFIKDSVNGLLDLSVKQLISKEKELLSASEGIQISMSRLIAEKSFKLTEEGDSYMARLLALQALPPNRPYTPEAERALRYACQHNSAILRGHTSSVSSAAFSPDGKRIVSASRDKTIRIWDAETGKELKLLEGHISGVNSASFSPDVKRIVSASMDGTVRIWDAETGKELKLLKGHILSVTSASFSPDGKRIVSASWDKTIRIWDAETGKELKKLEGHTWYVNSPAFSPDGKRIVSASVDNTIRIWDAESGKELKKLEGHTDWVYSAAFSPDGKRIVSASYDKTIRIWDAETGKELKKLEGHTDYVYSVVFSPDGKRIVSASGDNTIRKWDAETGKELKRLEGHTADVNSAAFSPDGKRIVLASADRTIRIWDAETGIELKKFEVHTAFVYSAAFSPDGNRIVSASRDSTIRIWDAETGKELKKLEGHTDDVRSAAFSPDGKRIVSASDDTTIRIWDAETGKELKKLEGHTSDVNSAAFSPDGRRIVSASEDKTIRIWDAETGKELKKLEGHTDLVFSAAFSPDGKRIVSASRDNTIRIWDAETGKELKNLEGYTAFVYSAAFSPDGNRIVSASADRTIRIWDAETGMELKKLEGHTRYVYSAAFSPDGKRIVSASQDETIRIWDAETGKELKKLEGHTSDVNSAAFSPDGKRIVSASWDNTVRIWDLPSLETLIEKTQKRFKNRQLTTEEKRQYYLE